MHNYGIRAREIYSTITIEIPHELVCTMFRQNPTLGEKSLLRAQGYIVQRQRIRNVIWACDPEAVQLRLQCHEYHVESQNALWHIDGYRRLIWWKIVIHGGIDGYSRLIVCY